MRSRNLSLIAVFMLGAVAAWGAPISYDSSAGDVTLGHITGSRTIPTGLTGSNISAFTISWDIFTTNGGATVTYQYTFSGLSGGGGHDNDEGGNQSLDYIVIDLSNNCTATGTCFNSLTGGSAAFGNFDGISGAVKLTNLTGGTIQFTSNRLPVWGDFFGSTICSGGGSDGDDEDDEGCFGGSVWNNGISNHGSTNNGDFIARPDGTQPPNDPTVPEPATAMLMLGALGALVAFRKRLQS